MLLAVPVLSKGEGYDLLQKYAKMPAVRDSNVPVRAIRSSDRYFGDFRKCAIERAEFLIFHSEHRQDRLCRELGIYARQRQGDVPEAVRLSLTHRGGDIRDLRFFDRRYPAIVGRLDDFTVALRAGAAYEFPVSLDQYWSESEFGMKLGAGHYRIQARFDGRGATQVNLDTPGIALMNFWKGTAQSNTVEFEVSPR